MTSLIQDYYRIGFEAGAKGQPCEPPEGDILACAYRDGYKRGKGSGRLWRDVQKLAGARDMGVDDPCPPFTFDEAPKTRGYHE